MLTHVPFSLLVQPAGFTREHAPAQKIVTLIADIDHATVVQSIATYVAILNGACSCNRSGQPTGQNKASDKTTWPHSGQFRTKSEAAYSNPQSCCVRLSRSRRPNAKAGPTKHRRAEFPLDVYSQSTSAGSKNREKDPPCLKDYVIFSRKFPNLYQERLVVQAEVDGPSLRHRVTNRQCAIREGYPFLKNTHWPKGND